MVQNELSVSVSNLQIRVLDEAEQIPYDLLLLSDDTKDAINKNLHDGELFVGVHTNRLIAAFILKVVEKDTIEIKNIAVLEELQGKGIGVILIKFIVKTAQTRGVKTLLVGTCDQCVKEIDFYQKNGFKISTIRKNFFIDNYAEPIYENGNQLKDMVMLSMDLVK